MAEEDFKVQCEEWIAKITKTFGPDAGNQLSEALDEMGCETKEELLDDIETDDWESTNLMDSLAQKSAFKDPKACKTFYTVFQRMVQGKVLIRLPDILNWEVNKEETKEAYEYMNKQVPSGEFKQGMDNVNLIKLVAIGRKNDMELVTLAMDLYFLILADEVSNNCPRFKNHFEWCEKMEFFKEYKDLGFIIRNAIPEFQKRIIGGGPRRYLANKINDDINAYIDYVLCFNQMLKNLIESEKCCPMQVDLVIFPSAAGGKQNDGKKALTAKAKVKGGDDDEDWENLINTQMKPTYSKSHLNNLPKEGIGAFLKRKGIEFVSADVNISDFAKTNRIISDLIKQKMGKKRSQRLIAVIDRSQNGDNNEADKVYVYQLSEPWDKLDNEYCDISMVYKTKSALLPKFNSEENDTFVGGSTDIADAGFAFSFHIHAANRIKCESWIKSQNFPFLPYQMCNVWPVYFAENSNEVKYNMDAIRKQWVLPIKDEQMLQWMKVIDPEFYQTLTKKYHPDFL